MASVRGLVGAIALSTVLAAAAGCTTDNPEPPAASPTPGSTEPSPVDLRLSVYGDEHAVDAWQQIADAFTEQEPDVRVRISAKDDARSSVAALEKTLPEGDGPDVFLLHQDWLADFVEAGHLQPVDALLEERGLAFGDDYQRVALTSFSAHARLQCMPAEMSPLVVFYNKKLMPRRALLAQGVVLPDGAQATSWSWADFTAAALAMTTETPGAPQRQVHPVYLPPDIDLLTAFLRSVGTDVVDNVLDPSSLTLASDEAVETIRSIAAVTRDMRLSPTAQQVADTDPATMFLEGRLGMYVGSRAEVPAMRAVEGLRFDVLPLPSFDRARSVSPVTGLCISDASEHVSEAADFIAFATGEKGAKIAAASGAMVPSSLGSIVSEDFGQEGEQPQHPAVFVTSVRRSDLLPYAVGWPEISDRVERVLTRIYLDPSFDLDERLVPALERLNARSEMWFDPSLVEQQQPSEDQPQDGSGGDGESSSGE